MKDLTLNRLYRFMVCLVCCLFVVSSLGLAFAVNPTPTPTPDINNESAAPNSDLLWHNAGCYGVWLLLYSWGIEITVDDVHQYSDAVEAVLTDLVIEYLDSLPSPLSLYTWVNPWLWDVDFWGNARFNSSMLEDVEYFADWLREKFGLTDNSTTILTPSYSVNGYTLYLFNHNYSAHYPDSTSWNGYVALTNETSDPNTIQGYFIIGEENNSYTGGYQYSPVYVSLSQITGSVTYTWYGINSNGEATWITSGSLQSVTLSGPSNYGVYYTHAPFTLHYDSSKGFFLPDGSHAHITNSEWRTFFSNLAIQVEGNQKIVTSTIMLPIETPDYNQGDSITIINGQPEYSILEWDGTVTVSNLPAIVSTGNIPVPGDELNPGLVNAWHPISTLIEMTADSMGMLIGIVYEFPEEVLIPIFAVLGGIIILGIIHAMKEH